MKRSHMIALLAEDARNYISNEKYGGELLDHYLYSGFKGFDNMTDAELEAELDCLREGEYSGWDIETGCIVTYTLKGDEWIRDEAEAV